MAKKQVSIIVPVYNEQEAIVPTLKKIIKAMNKSRCKYEIIAVDDCSTDKSGILLNKIRNKRLKVIRHPVNKGYGSSLKTGISASGSDRVLITDADGTYPIEDIPKLLKHIGNYDMVVGARTGEKVDIPFVRRPAKWFLTKFASYIASEKIPDLNSGFRVFKKSIALEFWKMLPERFSFTSTLTMACSTNGYSVKYIPINYFKRKGKSTIHPIKDFISFNKLLLKMALFFRPLRVFIPFSMFIFIIGLAVFAVGLLKFGKFLDATLAITIIASIQIFILGLIAELIVNKK